LTDRSNIDIRTTTTQIPGQLRPKEKPLMSSPTRTVEEIPAQPRSAGALTFAPDGTLFVGDSKSGAIFAYPNLGPVAAPGTFESFLFEDIELAAAPSYSI
jgi:sugar lactone lactonase YvrE